MEKSTKRGKIPQQDWPAIIKRYEAGETLASIARTYDCSPPAISYIVSRSRARDGTAGSTAEPLEVQLVKGHATTAPATEMSENLTGSETSNPVAPMHKEPQPIEPMHTSIEPAKEPEQREEPTSHESDGSGEVRGEGSPDAGRPQGEPSGATNSARAPKNSDQRRTLRLGPFPDGALRTEPQSRDVPRPHASDSGDRFAIRPPADTHQDLLQPGRQGPANHTPVAANGGAVRKMTEPQRADGGAFIDQALRQRVDGDISAFLAAFDAALAEDNPENRAGLREATDRLLRAGARTRIELERLEARVPLPPRDSTRQAPQAWRPR